MEELKTGSSATAVEAIPESAAPSFAEIDAQLQAAIAKRDELLNSDTATLEQIQAAKDEVFRLNELSIVAKQ